ncbi:rhodanese-like domain-containing protein [Nocardioides ginsengisoli]|uniref:Rhodanese-like domain-containing protein n=1 Tax=Nocardioides ginsengisoli TaxID=363868 RepID=A0ABW3VVQ0_9ACTN
MTESAIDRMLAEARRGLHRLTPVEAYAAQREGALLVDVRREDQRERFGAPADSIPIDLSILEWRLDPGSPWRIPATGQGIRLILTCQEGFSSSLAASRLQALGLDATDVDGGFAAWAAAGLPIAPELPPRVY